MSGLRCIGLICVLLSAGHLAEAQSVDALVNSATIGTEEAVAYTIAVSGAAFSEVTVPTPPEATGLQLTSRAPSQSTNVAWVNGEVTQTISFSWRYRPIAEGEATIGEATVEVAGNTYATTPITVVVVPQSQRPAAPARRRSIFDPFPDMLTEDAAAEIAIAERDVFIRATPSSTTPYVNEQVTISYELFFRQGMQPRNSRLADSWDAEGFWREDLPVEGRPMPRTSIEDGLRYSSIVVKRIAVFPTRSGSLTVDPLRIATEVFSPGGLGFGRSLFSRSNPYQQIERNSPEISMDVKPLPPNAPQGYRDAVGSYTMEARISRAQVEVGDPVELVIRIAGEGNISTLEGPAVQIPGAFEAYEPEITTQSESTSKLARGAKTFTYLMVPRANGTFTISPLQFSYLAPATGEYVTLEQVLPAIRVSGTAPAAVATSTLATGFPVDDIAGPHIADRWTAYPAVPLHRRWWPYVLIVAPLIVLAALAAWRRQATRMETDVAWARGRRAHPLARRHLKRALQLSKQGAPRALFVELERALMGFIGNRANVAELGLTRPQLDAELARRGVPGDTRKKLQDFLVTCDAARFAPEAPGRMQMEHAIAVASELIGSIEQGLRA